MTRGFTRRRPLHWLALSMLTVLGVAGAPGALAQEAKWTVRGALAQVMPSGDDLSAALPDGSRFRFAADDGAGLGLELEYRVRPRLGIELAALRADLDAELSIAAGGLTDREESAFELYSAGVNYLVTPGRRLQVHAGAFVAMVFFDDVIFFTESGRGDKLVFDDDVGFGVKLGLGRALGTQSCWVVSLDVRYLQAILEGEAPGQDADLDPLIVSVGIGYRF